MAWGTDWSKSYMFETAYGGGGYGGDGQIYFDPTTEEVGGVKYILALACKIA